MEGDCASAMCYLSVDMCLHITPAWRATAPGLEAGEEIRHLHITPEWRATAPLPL